MLEIGVWRGPFFLPPGNWHGTVLYAPEELQRCPWELLLLRHPVPQGIRCACRVLLFSSELPEATLRCVSAERVVSFGLFTRDSLTLAAMGEQKVISLQRELQTLSGRLIDPQELPLPTGWGGDDVQLLLAQAGLSLLLDLIV